MIDYEQQYAQCVNRFHTSYAQINVSQPYCNATWDSILCWPPTPAGTIVRLQCPPEKGLDTTKFATRVCGRNGSWLGRYVGEMPSLASSEDAMDSDVGWSNYTGCFTEEIRVLMEKLYSTTEADIKMKMNIAKSTRIVEMLCLSVSLLALLVSLVIFTYFSSLRNKRTKLHCNLFVAMFIQVFVRLVLYVDQWITRQDLDDAVTTSAKATRYSSIEKTPFLCESFYVLLEYARTAVFVWMFLEGTHLHTSIVVVFPRKMHYRVFHIVGWGLPLFLVIIWTTVMAKYYYNTLCWWGYPFSTFYWILEGPRMCIILINLFILLNIVCVVVMKLQETNSNEFQQIRKAVRAALLLLPLLGIPSILDAVPVPVESSPLRFAAWSYSTHTLSSLQGFFISMLYCFLNREVRNVVSKHWLSFRLSRRPFKDKTCCVPVDSGGRRSLNYKNNSTVEEPAQKPSPRVVNLSARTAITSSPLVNVHVAVKEACRSKPSSPRSNKAETRLVFVDDVHSRSTSPSPSLRKSNQDCGCYNDGCGDVPLVHHNGFVKPLS